MPPSPKEDRFRKQSRVAGAVIAGTMILWLGVQWLGPRVGMGLRYAVLFDLMALAAFSWALFVTYQAWRARHDD